MERPRPQTDASPSVRASDSAQDLQTAYLQSLTENNPIAIVVLDANDCVQMCNPAFERLFQHTQRELKGEGLDHLIAPENLANEANDLTRRVGTGSTVRATTRRRRRDGVFLDVQIIGVPLVMHGRQIGTIGMYEDITERKSAEPHSLRERHRRNLSDHRGRPLPQRQPCARASLRLQLARGNDGVD